MNIRQEFLDFFESKGHSVVSSSPLVPNDDSLLFVNAGMVQFKDIFTGKVPSSYGARATSCQLCLRAGGKHNDLENVGYTRRHHTLFEMLGNFSFGDYFKTQAIDHGFEFVTKVLNLPEDKIYATVHDSDDEAYELWQKHLPKERIKRMGDKDNFWQMGDTGPCGPCSEIFYDQGEEDFKSEEDYFGGEGDRFLEIWNLVFMQYERLASGEMVPLAKPSIDTGMGLERVQAIIEGKKSNFDSSLFTPLLQKIALATGVAYSYERGASHRVIADHVRSAVLLIADGVLFEKDGRGYVLRRIARRAIRHGYLLGLREPFMYQLVQDVVDSFRGAYPSLVKKVAYIQEHIENEEIRFFKTIANGMAIFNDQLNKTQEVFSGEVAFKLYDTYGFPLDLTEDMLKDRGICVDKPTYEACMRSQKDMARASWKGSGDGANEGDFKNLIDEFGINEFVGYESTQGECEILAVLDESFKRVDEIDKKGWVLFGQTPFYATSGGQLGDVGTLEASGVRAKVVRTNKFFELNLCEVSIEEGKLKSGVSVDAKVSNRDEVARHHSATHLLQASLRKTLGESVVQAGSYNDDSRLRFDFTYPKALTKEQISQVQEEVNAMVLSGSQGAIKVLPLEQAMQEGALAMFGEKYGDSVRVVSFDKHSSEFCGGTHVTNTALIGNFYITKETSVSSGVRRIEAVCGKAGLRHAMEKMKTLDEVSVLLKNPHALEAIANLQDQVSELKKQLKAQSSKEDLVLNEINGVKVGVCQSDGDIKAIIDAHKKQHPKIVLVLLKRSGDKIQVACGVQGAEVSAKDCLNYVLAPLGGKGGGRDDFATGGGKNAEAIDEAIQKGLSFVQNNL